MDVRQEVLEAEDRIRAHIRTTPVEFSPSLSDLGGCQVYLKLENFQLTGSFKLRGALNKFLSLSEADRQRGVVTASTGNHGAAVAYVLQKFKCPGTVYLASNAAPAKVDALRMYSAEVAFHGNDCVEAERFGRETAARQGQVYISPYNDPQVIGGQGTLGVELKEQVDSIGAVLVPVGGGGLIAGIAGYLKSVDPKIEILGCQPASSPVMYESIKEGRILDVPIQPTLSDATAGGLESGAITFGLCQQYVDDYVIVSEDEIKAAIRVLLAKHYILVEGAAALAVASFLKVRERLRNKSVVLILSGAKIGLDKLREVLRE